MGGLSIQIIIVRTNDLLSVLFALLVLEFEPHSLFCSLLLSFFHIAIYRLLTEHILRELKLFLINWLMFWLI